MLSEIFSIAVGLMRSSVPKELQFWKATRNNGMIATDAGLAYLFTTMLVMEQMHFG
jgi:hypothetical protein